MAQIYNLNSGIQGDTYAGAQFEILKNDVAMDLTGVIIKCQFKKKGTSVVLKTLTIGSGLTVINASNGIFKINSFKITFLPGIYVYDIQFVFSDKEITYIKGEMIVGKQVTN